MQGIINLLIAALPMVREYFTKNKGLNTTTGGFLGAFLVLAIQALNSGQADQFITFLQNQGEAGLISAAVVAGLRVAVTVYRAAKDTGEAKEQ